MLLFTVLKTALTKKNIYFLLPLLLCLVGAFIYYFSFIKLKPNDVIITTSDGTALFSNENPTFKVDFGSKENPQGQVIRFEAEASNTNPFEVEGEKSIFTKIAELFAPRKKFGIEMSLVGIDFSETEKSPDATLVSNVQTVAEILGTDGVETSTNLIDMGREIGTYDTEETISKPTIVNSNVANGIDLEYQILSGYGLKEEIVINDLEAYADSCGEDCSLPLNKFEFDLSVDDGVVLRKGWFTVDDRSTEIYYFVDGNGNYLAHFLPSFAIDKAGEKTYEVDLDIEEYYIGKFKAVVTVDSEWLLSGDRVYPIRIDPSIVHDDTSDFSGGIFNRTESVTGPKIQLLEPNAPIADANTVGLWHLDEASGSGAYLLDSSSSGNNGTPTGTTYSNAGRVGGARSFNGTSDYITGPDMAATTNLTVDAWFKTTSTTTGAIASNGSSWLSTNIDWMLYLNTAGQAIFRVYRYSAGVSVTTTAAYNDGNWHHVAGVISGTTASIYIDGVFEGAATVASYTANTKNFQIGVRPGRDSYFFNGYIDEVRISNIARTSLQIKNSYLEGVSKFLGTYTSSSLDTGANRESATLSWISSGVNTGDGEIPYSTTGLVAQWNFNETSGTSAVSGGTCGTSCNGTLTNMTTTGQDAAPMTGWTANNRRWGAGAVMFDGTNDYVSIPDNDSLSFGNGSTDSPFSISTWIKFDLVPSTGGYWILNKRDGSTNEEYQLTIYDGKIGFSLFTTAANYIGRRIVDVPEAGRWYQLTVTYDGSKSVSGIKMYLNGELGTMIDNVGGTYTGMSNGTQPVVIGKTGWASTYYLLGMIDSTQIYSRVLPATEILSNYQAGNIEFQYRVSTDNSTWSDWTSFNDGALMFDGTDDNVILGGESVFDFERTSTFSIESWIKTSYTGGVQNILSKMDNVAPFSGYDLHIRPTGYIAFMIINTWSTNTLMVTTSGTVCNDGNWHHIVVTYAGTSAPSGVHIYVDGVDQSLTTNYNSLSASTLNNISLNIGSRNNAAYFFKGIIDSTRVYSRVLGASEIATNYTSQYWETPSDSTSLLAQWSLNETSGTTAAATGLCSVGSTICNGTLTNFSNTTGKDVAVNSGWTSTTKKASDSQWELFNNPYLYKPTDTGLVSYWSMDETTGSTVADAKGTNGGTATGTTIVSGKNGKGRYLNGSSDYVEIADNDSLDLTNNYSLSVWVYRSADSGTYERILSKSGTDGYDYWMQISTTDTFMCGFLSSTGGSYYANTTATIPLNIWTNLVCTLDASNVWAMYINGTVASSTSVGTAAPSRTSTRNLQIGRLGSGSAWTYSLNGMIDEVRIFNTAISASQVQSDYIQGISSNGIVYQEKNSSVIKNEGTGANRITNSLRDGLVAHWNLDESSGTTLVDSFGGNTGTASGTTVAPGKYNNARSFNGSSDYIVQASGSNVDVTGDITVETWVNPTSFSASGVIIHKSTQYSVYISTSGYVAWADSSNWSYASFGYQSIGLTTGSWQHLVVTKSGSTVTIYLDGFQKVSKTFGSAITSTTNLMFMGCYAGASACASSYFNGSLDEVKIYNVAKTAAEVLEEYNATSTYYTNYALSSSDISDDNTIAVDVAGDKVGAYSSLTWGESAYANYQPDSSTIGLWDFNGLNMDKAYQDRSGGQNNGVTTYYGIEYGIRSTNATYIINQYGGASNAGEMDITCTGGDATCVIVTKEGITLPTPSINSGVPMVDATTGTNWLMYSPSLTAQGITIYSGASDNYIAVYYTGSAWQYDNNTAYVTFTPQSYNILVGVITRFTATSILDTYPTMVEGKMGGGLSFDGTNDYVSTASIGYGTDNILSIEAWVKTSTCTGTDGLCYIVAKNQFVGTTPYTLSVTSAGVFRLSVQGTDVLGLNGGYNDGQWHYVVGMLSGTTASIYVDGVFQASGTVTPTTNTELVTIGGDDNNPTYRPFNGTIDEVRISNAVRTADQIRQAYEVGLRTHDITVDFGATLNSGNLITGSGDTSFTVDATTQGLSEMGSNLYVGDKIIVREVSSGTEYLAQGTVSAITAATGVTTVTSWDTNSTFPSGGFTTRASVFKWQTEYIPIKNRTISTQVDTASLLTLRLTGAFGGRNVWIDNLRTSDGYLTDSTGEEITFPYSAQYLQYKAIITSQNSAVTPYISQVQFDYEDSSPTLDQIMRHGKWFDSGGTKKTFWWANETQ